MYITLYKKNVLICGVILALIINMRFLGVINLNIDSIYYYFFSWIIIISCLVFSINESKQICKEYKFLSFFLCYILFSQIILCVYSIAKYNENIMDVVVLAGNYNIVLLSVSLLYLFSINLEEVVRKKTFFLEIVYICLCILYSIAKKILGIKILNFHELDSKTQLIRLDIGALFPIIMISTFYYLITKKSNKKMILLFILELVAMIFVCQTRAITASVLLALVLMNYSNSKTNYSKLVKCFFAIVVFVIIINAGFIDLVLNRISPNPLVNPDYKSTLARLNAIQYFWQFFKNNPLLGQGWIRPKNQILRRIWSGPGNAFYFDDLGILGQFFRQGILGGVIYICFIGRLLYIIFKMSKTNEYRVFIVGCVTYLLCSLISLNCFDAQRIIAVPFVIAYSEWVYKKDFEQRVIN